MSEKSVQHDVRQCYERVGGVVYNFAQPRASKQTPGIPDLYVFLPRAQCAIWHEVKTARGRRSPAQEAFAIHCASTDVPYVVGGVDAAVAMLRLLGVLD